MRKDSIFSSVIPIPLSFTAKPTISENSSSVRRSTSIVITPSLAGLSGNRASTAWSELDTASNNGTSALFAETGRLMFRTRPRRSNMNSGVFASLPVTTLSTFMEPPIERGRANEPRCFNLNWTTSDATP